MRILIATLAVMMTPVCHAALSASEQHIAEQVKLMKQDQLRLLKQTVNIQSGTLNTIGVRQVGNLISKELQRLHFKTKWISEPASMNRAGTLVATHEGNSGKRLLLIGHLDTVFSVKTPFHAYTQKKYSAKGQGVIDDKGGVAVLLYALKALQSSGELKNANIIVVLTGDEEDSGKPTTISRKPLIEAAKKSEIALDFEPAISVNTATIARRGITNWTITTYGNASHSATIFQKDVGAGAIFGLADELNSMRTELQQVKNLSFNPGLILGGSSLHYDAKTASGQATGKENIVASIAIAKGDLRYLDETQKNVAEEKLRAIVAKPLNGVKSTIEFVDGIPPMAGTEGNLQLLNLYSEASVDLGLGKVVPLDAGVRGAGDISYVAGIVPQNLSGLGPEGSGSHTVIESIDLQSLTTQTQRAAILISRLLKN